MSIIVIGKPFRGNLCGLHDKERPTSPLQGGGGLVLGNLLLKGNMLDTQLVGDQHRLAWFSKTAHVIRWTNPKLYIRY